MKERHPYHGITSGVSGWMIQFKLNHRMVQFNAFASSAEEAARRHDVAMKRLQPWMEAAHEPNFPGDFETLVLPSTWQEVKDNDVEEGLSPEKRFFRALQHRYEMLVEETKKRGFNLEDQWAIYDEARKERISRGECGPLVHWARKHKEALALFKVLQPYLANSNSDIRECAIKLEYWVKRELAQVNSALVEKTTATP